MQGKKLLVVVVLDESGSMESIKDKTISSFNEYAKSLYPQGKMCHISLLKFNSSDKSYVCIDVPVKYMPLLDSNNYKPNFSTPLYDAVGRAISDADSAKKTKENPDILFIVATDGEENDSRQYNREQIVDLIKEREGKGWTFVYLGANQDSWKSASQIGYANANNVQNYIPTDVGTAKVWNDVLVGTSAYLSKRNDFYASSGTSGAADLKSVSYSNTSFFSGGGEEGNNNLIKKNRRKKNSVKS